MFTIALRDPHRARTQNGFAVHAVESRGKPYFYNGDERQIDTEIDCCRATHADHHVRLNIEDYSCHSRFSFVDYNPSTVGS